ncbi:winged helix-turn-helix domain-containing protein [Mesorhizobium sp. SP-1A]|uniref:winged helix-turn-helix domain-containing protein n=1 Tax=Mesorhizobium sp. SP-1A TaxID=3077840 RepID=UPI0028F6E7DF|nr:winged helix-turn-helix domain-containing protein [Mesorhizobium sp. SP-1A]
MGDTPCPCCGQPLPLDGDLRIDDAGFVVRGGAFATLTQQEHAVLTALQMASPRIRSREQLLADLYQLRCDEEPEIKIIDVWVCKLRKKLKPLGINIDTVWGRGYRLLPCASTEAT